MVFHFAQAKQELKNDTDQGRLTFLVRPHQTLSRQIALLFAAFACDSKVSLLVGRRNRHILANALNEVVRFGENFEFLQKQSTIFLYLRYFRIVNLSFSFFE